MLKKTTNEIKHTAHSSYRCQYHIVFAPKYRRKEIYGKIKKDTLQELSPDFYLDFAGELKEFLC